MTSSESDRVSVPKCHIAAGILLQIGTPLFQASMMAGEPIPGDERFEAWWTIRTTAQQMQDRGTMRLDEHQDRRLMGALKIAHDALCARQPQLVYARHCKCLCGALIFDLLELLESAITEAARV